MTVTRAHGRARAHAPIALVAFALCGCHHAPVHHPGEEFLRSIEIHGNHAISAGDLRAGLALREIQKRGGAPDPYLVTQDGQRIRGMYLRRGYFDVDVSSRVERHGDAAIAIYTVREGPRANTRVEISGLPPGVSAAKVRAKLPLHDGDPFAYAPYDKAKPALLGVVKDAGYAHARLDARVVADRARRLAIVQLAFDPGPKSFFGDVTITGAPPALEDAVRARLAFARGEAYSTAAIVKTQRAIYDMKRFSTVRVVPDLHDGTKIPVKITLDESARHELSLGGGFGIDPAAYILRTRAGYAITGWPFPLERVDLDLRPAIAKLRDGSGWEPRIRALAQLTRMDLFRPFMDGTVAGGYNYLTVEAYTSYGPNARLGLQTRLFVPELQLSVGWQFEYLAFRDISPLVDPATAHALGLDHPERLGQYQQVLQLDLRDNPLEPHRGVYGEVRVNEGTALAGGAPRFVQVTPDLRGYLPLGPITVAARARYGTFFGDVPPTERYYAGGANSQRGFSERRLAPTLTGMVSGQSRSVPIGGSTLFVTSVEVRGELGKIRGMGLGGALFLDGGDVTETRSELDLGNLHWALGAGLRLFTILGPIRFDFGYRLNRTGPNEPEPGSHYAFHLSIGEAF